MPYGKVYLIGAGPGAQDLITMRGARLLAQADVVLYDALVTEEMLALCPQAEKISVGKRAGQRSTAQGVINQQLVDCAARYGVVVRLKGGDPFVFGRGGEEALTLVENGIPFRIVPGISAGIGGLAYAGIPVTHRDSNSAVAFVTGHDATGEVPDSVDWAALAKGAPVIVLYMALKHIERIAERLISGGRDPNAAVAVIAKATTPEQRVLETTLSRAAADVAEAGIEPPAMVVIGEVVKLRAAMDWLGAIGGRKLVADPLGQRQRDQAG